MWSQKKQRKDIIEGNTYESNGVGEAGKKIENMNRPITSTEIETVI